MKNTMQPHDRSKLAYLERLERNRLTGRLAAWRDKRLIIISGVPAQGKTTLAKQYIGNQACDSAWISVNGTDAIARYFCETLLCAMGEKLSQHKHKSFRKALTKIDDTAFQALSHYRRWAATLIREIRHRMTIVIDNLDNLVSDAPSLDIIEDVVVAAPTHVQFVLISRSIPRLKFQRLVVDGVATALTDQDLRLTFEEFQMCWLSSLGSTLSPENLRRMHVLTHGWLGALALFATACDANIIEGRESFFSSVLEGSLPAEFLCYFQQEVFGDLLEEDRNFLCEIATLKRIYPASICEVLQNEAACRILEHILSMNLFIDRSVDEDKQPYYSLYPLFRRFLMEKHLVGHKRCRQIYHRAARYYESLRKPEIAFDFYLKAGLRREGRKLFQLFGIRLLTQFRPDKVATWLSYFGEREVNAEPWLRFFKLMLHPHKEVARNTEIIRKIVNHFYQKGQIEAALVCLSMALEKLFTTGMHYVDEAYVIRLAYRMLKKSKADHSKQACARLWLLIGKVCAVVTGDIAKGIVACETARFLGHQLQDGCVETESITFIAICNALLGRNGEDEKNREHALQQTCEQDKRLNTLGLFSICTMDLMSGEKDAFERHFAHLMAKAQEDPLLLCMKPYVILLQAAGQISSGRLPAAEERIALLFGLLEAVSNDALRYHVALLMAQLKYLQGDLEAARQWIKKSDKQRPAFISDGGLYCALANLLAGIIHFHTEAWGLSRACLEKALRIFSDQGAALLVCETSLMLGLLEIKDGNTASGRKHLKCGLDLIVQNPKWQFILLGPLDVGLCLCAALENSVAGIGEGVAALARHEQYRKAMENGLKKRVSGYPPKIQKKLKTICKTIYLAGLPKVHITTLGAFCVRFGQEPLDARQWAGHQPMKLLRAIIALGCHNVTRDFLVEELWPELTPSGMERAFKVTLHRLRKSFEPGMTRRYGSSYIHFTNNLVSLNKDLVDIDFKVYEQYLKQAYQLAAKAEIDAALMIHEKTHQIFAGTFLPDDLYASWAEAKRESLSKLRIEQLFAIADIHEVREQKNMAIKAYEKVLQCDPFNEFAVQRLMLHYSELGCKAMAMKVYTAYQELMRRDLGLMPDDATLELKQCITSKEGLFLGEAEGYPSAEKNAPSFP